jgi:hypothetical protein
MRVNWEAATAAGKTKASARMMAMSGFRMDRFRMLPPPIEMMDALTRQYG